MVCTYWLTDGTLDQIDPLLACIGHLALKGVLNPSRDDATYNLFMELKNKYIGMIQANQWHSPEMKYVNGMFAYLAANGKLELDTHCQGLVKDDSAI